MTYAPSTTWTSAIAEPVQEPVYFLRLASVTTDFASGYVRSAATTKSICMQPPSGGGVTLDPLEGTYNQSEVTVELADVSGQITTLVCTEASSAPVSSLINRKATIYGGYRHFNESDYPPVFTGRIRSIEMTRDRTGYRFGLQPEISRLDADIMTRSSSTTPTTVVGNPVNVFWSILTGVFSTSHGTFPLTTFSSATTTTAAPTGLSFTSSELSESLMVSERDTWYPDALVEVKFTNPEKAKSHLQDEFFRVFQCFPTISGDGKIGVRFLQPPLPPASVTTITDAQHVVSVGSWKRLINDHLNSFVVACETTKGSGTFDTYLFRGDTAEDTADQASTGETIQFMVESRWLSSAYDGANLAAIMVNRTRARYKAPPSEIAISTNFKRRNVEHGDIISATLNDVPNLWKGTRGVDGNMMVVSTVSPNYETGLIDMTLYDANYHRYGVVAPAGHADYAASSTTDRGMFVFISSAAGDTFSNGDPAIRII